MHHLRTSCVLLLAFALSVSAAFSQAVTATIVGSVTDASGAVIANAKITLTETNTGVDRANMSNSSGNFTYPNLPNGRIPRHRGSGGLQEGSSRRHQSGRRLHRARRRCTLARQRHGDHPRDRRGRRTEDRPRRHQYAPSTLSRFRNCRTCSTAITS